LDLFSIGIFFVEKRFQIAGWVFEPSQCQLSCGAENIRLEPKVMSLLVVLTQAEGQLVSRKELFDTIWPNQHVSDFALNTLIANLRKSLNSYIGLKGLVETRTKLGYRLTEPVIWLEDVNEQQLAEDPIKKKKSIDGDKIRNSRKYIFAMILIIVFVVAGYLAWTSEKTPLPDERNRSFSENKNSERKGYSAKSVKYTVRVTLSYSFSAKDHNKEPYCKNFDYEMLAKAIYENEHWKLIGNTVTFNFDYSGRNFSDIEETHQTEYINFIGKREVDITTISIDSVGNLSGVSKMKVYEENDVLICKGRSLFVGEKI
jgi:DNA-binding winged helix-turn-helix (wHTH) protein